MNIRPLKSDDIRQLNLFLRQPAIMEQRTHPKVEIERTITYYQQSLTVEGELALVATDHESIVACALLHISTEQQLLHASGGFLALNPPVAYPQLLDYCAKHFPGWQLLFTPTEKNFELVTYLETLFPIEKSSALDYRGQLQNFNTTTVALVPLTAQQFLPYLATYDSKMHAAFWHGERLLAEFTKWRVYGTLATNGVVENLIALQVYPSGIIEVFYAYSTATPAAEENFYRGVFASLKALGYDSFIWFAEESLPVKNALAHWCQSNGTYTEIKIQL